VLTLGDSARRSDTGSKKTERDSADRNILLGD
jgi:hypothetical protein